MYLQCGPAGINLIFILFLSESPRWLYARGKKDQARAVLAKFHSQNGDPYSPLIDLEIHEFEQNIDLAGTDREFWNFKTLFNTFGARYRFGLCALVSIWGQLSGNGLITYFLPVLLEQAGIVSTDRQRILNLANSITSMAGALTGRSHHEENILFLLTTVDADGSRFRARRPCRSKEAHVIRRCVLRDRYGSRRGFTESSG